MTDTAPQPATATEARAVLDAKIADKEFGARVLAGDIAANSELKALHAKIAEGGDDVVTAAMNGDLPDLASSEQRLMADTAAWLRGRGFTETQTRQILDDKFVPQPEDIENARMVKARLKHSKEFQDRFSAGEPDVCNLVTAADSVLDKAARRKAWNDATGKGTAA